MLPLFIIIFLFVQVLHASEFPRLMESVKISWNQTDLTKKIDVRQTTSIDGQAPNFVLCGPFLTAGNDGFCTYEYTYNWESSPTTVTQTSGSGSTDAKLVSSLNDTFSCMSVSNPIPDFVNIYAKQDDRYGWYSVEYKCGAVPKDYTMTVIFGIGAVILLAAVGFIAFKLGQKKNANELQQNAYGSVISGGRY